MAWGMIPVQENAKKSKNDKGHVFKYARGGENSHDFC